VRGTPLDCLVKALLNDLRYSVRSLARTPVLTVALLATVAVGTGAHATVSAFVNGLLTSHPAWARDARLVEVHWRDASGAFTGVPRERYEMQMLLGVADPLRRRVVAAGHRLRVYVPFGEDWHAYSLRRLRENPAIAGHVTRALLGMKPKAA
jgi:hypothetical protein